MRVTGDEAVELDEGGSDVAMLCGIKFSRDESVVRKEKGMCIELRSK
jgi:hypothetical protein